MRRSNARTVHMHSLERRKSMWAYLFLLPWFVMFCVFYAYPFVYGIVVSFTDFTLGSMKWNGLQNYRQIFSDYAFWRSLLGTVCYCAIIIPLEVFIPLWAANTLRPHGRVFNTLTKLLFYIPGIVCSVVMVIVWKFILSPGSGLLNDLLIKLEITGFSIFDQAVTSIPVMSLMIVFTCLGSNLIIYCAAINGIPAMYYEAAELDGATRRQQFHKVTIPMVHSTVIYVLVTSTIATLQVFVIPQLMTGGGPNYTSSSLLMMIYNSAFVGGQFGYASAIGVMLFIITALVAVVQFRIMRRDQIEY